MKLLLHICCAVCASSCIERLRQEGHQVSGYFYNPNIQPLSEYMKRLEHTRRLASMMNFPLIVGEYDMHSWFVQVKGLEDEPEGGKRCAECFAMRLKATAKIVKINVFDAFTTTLTVSPHKNTKVVNEIGQHIGDNLFLRRDFKKQDGFKRAQEVAKQKRIYRQDYCGCIFSQDGT